MPDFITSSFKSKIKSPSPSRNAGARLKRHAKEYSLQKICLHVPGNNYGKLQQLNIPRARITRDFLQGLVKGNSEAGEKYVVQYLASNDGDGTIVQLDRVQIDCRPPPTSYTVVTKAEHTQMPTNHNGDKFAQSSVVVHSHDGQCKVYCKSSTFSGQVDENDEPSGSGEIEYRDGDIVTGSFTTNAKSIGGDGNDAKAKEIDFEANPYAETVPHGPVKISFADGSIYEGEMKYGHISGQGTYVNAMGDRYEGIFELGLLVKGEIEYASGEVAEGRFRDGENLHGFGRWSDSKREISGHFEDGLLNGKATIVYKEEGINPGSFRGFFHQGSKHLHGVVLANDGIAIEGSWASNMPVAGGRARNVVTGKSWPIHDQMTLPGNISKAHRIDQDFASARAAAIEEDTRLRADIREKNCKAFDKSLKKLLSRRDREQCGRISSAKMAREEPKYFIKERRQIRPKSISGAIERPGLRWEYVDSTCK